MIAIHPLIHFGFSQTKQQAIITYTKMSMSQNSLEYLNSI